MNTPLQKPTREQVEKYIKYADAELGPECEDEWVEWCRQVLRAAVLSETPTLTIHADGSCMADAAIPVDLLLAV